MRDLPEAVRIQMLQFASCVLEENEYDSESPMTSLSFQSLIARNVSNEDVTVDDKRLVQAIVDSG